MALEDQQITELLVNSFSQAFSKDINDFKFDLSEKETLKAAEISRKSCEYHESGIFVLIVYFVRSCKNL